MMKCVSFSTGSIIQSAPERIPMTERQVETIGNQLKFISTPNPFLILTFSDPGSGKMFIEIIVNLSKIWNGASMATCVALMSCK